MGPAILGRLQTGQRPLKGTLVRTIFILMDSLNRHYLPMYGGWARTPNLQRLADRGVIFDNHWCGSLPCMPARREMMTGRLNFLETPWGPIEPWDDCLPPLLRQQRQTYSHLITDHYHYFHSGGEVYHTLFDSWEFERGQEGDAWRPLVKAPPVCTGRGKLLFRGAYWKNRALMDTEDDLDYPTPRCFRQAIDFLAHNHQEDNWHLHLEVFDPHEPFDCPKKYRDLFHDTWRGGHFTWPEYAPLDPTKDDAATVEHIRKCYAGTLFMADLWLGKFLDKMDRYRMWRDTTVILTTDHGHLLGEHGCWAKNYMMDYAELAHIPLMICDPQVKGGRRTQALTASMDLMPTLAELHGVKPPAHVHGRSLLPVLRRRAAKHHDAVLYGYFGKDVNLTDGRYTYCRQPLPGSTVHHHTAMPRTFSDFLPRELLAGAKCGAFLEHCHGVPHYRITRPSHRHHGAPDFNPIYDVQKDPGQTQPIRNAALESQLAKKMKKLLKAADAPACQYRRLGL